MEGPTPVSALIHAATMVTAGVYMVARAHPIFDRSPFALGTVAIIGCATAFFAATIGLMQTDIKRVLAYSTVSQLGYMFLACGVASYSSAIFHVVTHAFFKALLFLAAGSVIHALSGEQDMRVMGGLWRKIPITFWTMTVGVVAISGIPPLSGFFSKDEILYQTFNSTMPGAKLLWFVGLVTAGLTAFYMFRLYFLTFFGESRAALAHRAHTGADAPSRSFKRNGRGVDIACSAPCHCPLAGPARTRRSRMITGMSRMKVPGPCSGRWSSWRCSLSSAVASDCLANGNFLHNFLAPVLSVTGAPEARENRVLEVTLAVISTLTALSGFGVAYLFYMRRPGLPGELAARFRGRLSAAARPSIGSTNSTTGALRATASVGFALCAVGVRRHGPRSPAPASG